MEKHDEVSDRHSIQGMLCLLNPIGNCLTRYIIDKPFPHLLQKTDI